MLIGIVLYACTPATAGFVGDLYLEFQPPRPHPGPGGRGGPPAWARNPDWVVEMIGEKRQRAELFIPETLEGDGEYPVLIEGETDEDPIMAISKAVLNASDYAWYSYEVLLEGAVGITFVNGSASSDIFSVLSEEPLKIVFGAPDPVLPTQTVTLNFEINIATSGGFGFTLVQSVVPEPATLSVLILGAGVVLFRRKRR